MGIRRAARRDEDPRRRHLVARVGPHLDAAPAASGLHHRGAEPDVDTLGAQDPRQQVPVIGQVPRKEPGTTLDHRHRNPEPLERLGRLAGHRAATDHDQRIGRPLDLEEVLAGEDVDVGDAVDRRNERPTAGAHQREASPQYPAPNGDLTRSGDHGLTLDDRDAEISEAVGVVVGAGDLCLHRSDPSPHGFEVDRRLTDVHAEQAGSANRVRNSRARDQGLRRYAAGPETVAPES